ncbi:MAG TPA: plastocyanin/azurin family copper-binding protein [Kofleriaceae bacterium]|nr:plastocyanin/azurin family copper-binding protein [Kofleriaceae bacterium]
MFRSSLVVSIVVSLVALGGCGGDDGGKAIDAAVVDAPVADAAPDASAIDARPTDAATDASGIDQPPPPPVLNGCVADTAVDLTADDANRTIQFASFLYAPPCVMIRAGQTVTWTGDFSEHPLTPGAIVEGTPTDQPGNPIPPTDTGTSASVTFPATGDYGYYCAHHFGTGMMGAVYVVP